MYHVYILRCSDNSLYTGIAKELDKRLKEHSNGSGSKYVRSRLPFSLVFQETHETKEGALQREAKIKAMDREEKLALLS